MRDIEIVAAFDVNATKVGQELSVALRASPNNTHIFADVPPGAIIVERGPTMDGIGRYLTGMVAESNAPVADVAASAGAQRRGDTRILSASWVAASHRILR